MKIIKIAGLLLISSMFCVSAWCVENDIIKIYDADGLDKVRNNLSGHYKLMNNIDLGGRNWKPIGTINRVTEEPFTGEFDGNSCIISNFKVRDWSHNNGGGFIGVVGKDATIRGLQLHRAQVFGIGHTGGLARVNEGNIEYCSVVMDKVSSTHGNAAGLVCRNFGNIINSYSDGTVSSTHGNAAGLVSWNNGNIINSYSVCEVSGKSKVAGLVYFNGGHIENCYAGGAVSTTAGSAFAAAGLVQHQKQGGITKNSYWDIKTTGQEPRLVDFGEGKSNTEMMQQATYVEWNFADVGGIWKL